MTEPFQHQPLVQETLTTARIRRGELRPKQRQQHTSASGPQRVDLLERFDFADALLRLVRKLSGGAAISVEGAWGSGKSWVLEHLAASLADELSKGTDPAASAHPASDPTPEGERVRHPRATMGIYGLGVSWINPWQMAEPNLLAAVVRLLVMDCVRLEECSSVAGEPTDDHAQAVKSDENEEERTTPTIAEMIRKSLPLLLKLAMEGADTFGPLKGLGAMAGTVHELMALWTSHRETNAAQPADVASAKGDFIDWRHFLQGSEDPVDQMARALAEMVSTIRGELSKGGAPLYIFVDDMDRCLPEVQVRILRDMNLLAGLAKGRLALVAALDRDLVCSSLRTHYQSPEMDGNLYLQKLFQVSLVLPEPPADDAWLRLAPGQWAAMDNDSLVQEKLRAGLGILQLILRSTWEPRQIKAVFTRIELALGASGQLRQSSVHSSQANSMAHALWALFPDVCTKLTSCDEEMAVHVLFQHPAALKPSSITVDQRSVMDSLNRARLDHDRVRDWLMYIHDAETGVDPGSETVPRDPPVDFQAGLRRLKACRSFSAWPE